MRLGGGRFSYEVVPDWGSLPTGVSFGYTHGVTVDAHDNVYVHNRSRDAVIIFDRQGHFLRAWGPEFAQGAHGMYLALPFAHK